MLRRHWNANAKQRWQRSLISLPPPLVCLQPAMRSGTRARRSRWNPGALRHAIRIFDAFLRRLEGVFEFTSHRRCVLRIAVRRTGTAIILTNGGRLAQGTRIADLHLWNEQFVPPPPTGPNFGWVKVLQRQVLFSLAELAAYAEANPSMRDVAAFRARVAFASTNRQRKMALIAGRFGLECLAVPVPPRLSQKVHDFFDNFWLVGLVWTFNPRALRGRVLARHRDEFWISRSALIARFGTSGHTTIQRHHSSDDSQGRHADQPENVISRHSRGV
jgi:hypothetical protein